MNRLERTRYIGGHDASALVGRNPFRSRLDVYAKIVLENNPDIGEKPAVRRGTIIEPGFLDYIERRVDRPLDRDVFLVDPDVPYFGCTIDAIDSTGVVYEVTTATTRSLAGWGPDGTEEAKEYKWCQTQWELGISEKEVGEVWLFVADTGEIRRYPCPRRDDVISELRSAAEAFYFEHVVPKRPPELTDEDARKGSAILDALYERELVDSVEPSDRLVEAATAYDVAREAEKAAKAEKDAAAAVLKSELGDAARSAWEGGRVSWTSSKLRPSVSWQDVARALADGAGVSEDEFQRYVTANTRERSTSRALRVYLTSGEKTTKAKKEKADVQAS